QLHGDEPSVQAKYDYLYSEEELGELVGDARILGAKAKRVFVVFNNNNRDYPAVNALAIRRLLGQPASDFEALKAAWKTGRRARKDLPRDLLR
ncbi:MAG: DUF72 domain-containing protein, partial [candidate division NC10 bacterium]